MRSLLPVILGIFLYSGTANAESWLVASIASYHVKRGDYCEVNPGIGFEQSILKDTRLVAGTYQNSLCHPSNYIGVSWTPFTFANWRGGAAFIAITGYEENKAKRGSKVLFAPLPTLSYEGARWGANFIILPPYREFHGALGLQVKFRFP